MSERRTIGIWGVYGRGNYGNEAALTAFLGQLEVDRFTPVLFTEAPQAATAWHGVEARSLGTPYTGSEESRLRRAIATSWNRLAYLTKAFRATRHVDAVVIAGSGGLERYGSGSFGTPFEVWTLAMACRIQRRPFILLNIGVEYLPRRIARYFVRSATRAATYRSYRDIDSQDAVRQSGTRDRPSDRVVTDMVFGLDPTLAEDRDEDLVVVGVMDYWGRDSAHEEVLVHGGYADRTLTLIRNLRATGHSIILIGGDDGDLELAEIIRAQLDDPEVMIVPARTTEDLTRTMSRATAVVGTRYHTVIMALLARVPVISTGYGRKHPAMLKQLGLPDLHRDTESFTPENVAELIAEVTTGDPHLRDRIDAGVKGARAQLDAQWPEVISTLAEKSRARR